jgi:hypothetical protein
VDEQENMDKRTTAGRKLTGNPAEKINNYLAAAAAAEKLAAILGGIAILALGVATQVWEFPKPRTEFGMFFMCIGLSACTIWFLAESISNLADKVKDGKEITRRDNWGIFAQAVLVIVPLCLCFGFIVIGNYGTCLLVDIPVCTLKATTP